MVRAGRWCTAAGWRHCFTVRVVPSNLLRASVAELGKVGAVSVTARDVQGGCSASVAAAVVFISAVGTGSSRWVKLPHAGLTGNAVRVLPSDLLLASVAEPGTVGRG